MLVDVFILAAARSFVGAFVMKHDNRPAIVLANQRRPIWPPPDRAAASAR
jgi:hypothetical protein